MNYKSNESELKLIWELTMSELKKLSINVLQVIDGHLNK
jgi:hypothetical protein